MDDWGQWFRGLSGGVVNLAAQKKYVLDPQVEAAKWQALGDMGYYREGQAGTTSQPMQIAPGVLLAGAAILVVLMLKD